MAQTMINNQVSVFHCPEGLNTIKQSLKNNSHLGGKHVGPKGGFYGDLSPRAPGPSKTSHPAFGYL